MPSVFLFCVSLVLATLVSTDKKKRAEFIRWELNHHSETNSFCETFYVLGKSLRLGKQFSYCWLHYLRKNAGNSFCKTVVGGETAEKWSVFVNWRDLNLDYLLTSRAGGGKLLNDTVWFASSVKSLPHQTFWWYGKDWQEPQEGSGNAQSDFCEPCGKAAAPGRAGGTELQLFPQPQPREGRDYLGQTAALLLLHQPSGFSELPLVATTPLTL